TTRPSSRPRFRWDASPSPPTSPRRACSCPVPRRRSSPEPTSSSTAAARSRPSTPPSQPKEPPVPEAYLVEAVRSPVCRKGTALAEVHPADLGAHVLNALVDRSGIDPSAVDDVVFGCVDTIGPQAGDI